MNRYERLTRSCRREYAHENGVRLAGPHSHARCLPVPDAGMGKHRFPFPVLASFPFSLFASQRGESSTHCLGIVPDGEPKAASATVRL